MLRALAFENFLCFKNHQSLEFHNGPNFIVGANATGKSTIFELTRRCLSKTVSASDSSVNDTNRDAFVISKFEITRGLSDKVPEGCYLYSLYVRRSKDKNNDRYKLVCITNKEETNVECYLNSDGTNASLTGGKKEALQAMKDLITKSNGANKGLESINKVVTERGPDTDKDCEAILQTLNNAVVVTFPIRSPGPIQWSHSKNIGKGNEHYVTASKNAEILQQLLNSPDVNQKDSEDIFKEIIHPLDFTFDKREDDSTITLEDDNRKIPLLKVPEGIIEAKQFSLMFANENFQTLMLEEPDRAMHPQMIQKLRDCLIRKCKEEKKTVIFISHQPEMINRWTMQRLHVCRRKRDRHDNFKHFICNWGKDVKNTHQHQDQLKQILYSGDVLFVDGIIDKSVIRWVFDRVLDVEHLNGFNDSDLATLKEKIAGIQIISMEGGKGYRHMREAAEHLDLPFLFLFDANEVFEYEKDKQQKEKLEKKVYDTLLGKEKEDVKSIIKTLELLSSRVLRNDAKKRFDLPSDSMAPKDIREHLEKRNVFLWDSRNLEIMISKRISDIRDQSTRTTPDQSTQTTSGRQTPTTSDQSLESMDKKIIVFLKSNRKTAILEMDRETAEHLAKCLLNGEEMRTFLRVLLKRERNPNTRENRERQRPECIYQRTSS